MNPRKRVAVVVGLVLAAAPGALALAAPAPPTDAQVAQRVDALLARMTLEEKVGQLTQIAGVPFFGGPGPEETLRKSGAGSILWLNDTKKFNELQRIAVEHSRLKIPVLYGLDVIHGYRTIFPVPLALAASWDPSVHERAAAIAAKEARAAGIHWTFAPMLDIARDARWGRIVEGAGEDPFLGAAMAAAQVRGFQGPYLGAPDRVLACAKHFAAYGAAEGGRDYDPVYVSEGRLRNVYFPPFLAAVKAGVGSFMSAYMDLNDVPAAGNRWLLRDVLRGEWGFEGFVVSDAMAVGNLVIQNFARDGRDAAQKALSAGLDMDMASNTYPQHLAGLVEDGKLTAAQLDEAVRPRPRGQGPAGPVRAPLRRRGARGAGAGGPRAPPGGTPRGAEVDGAAAQRGQGAAAVEGAHEPRRDRPPRGLEGRHRGLVDGLRPRSGRGHRPRGPPREARRPRRVDHAPGPEIKREIPSMFEAFIPGPKKPSQTPEQAAAAFQHAVETARGADVVIAVLGELANMSGEAASRGSLDLPGRQEELLKAVVALGKPVVLVLLNGRPLSINWAAEHVPAILEAWEPGTEGGNAVADVLFGDANPGGKLPVTFPRSGAHGPLYYARNLTHQPEGSPRCTSRATGTAPPRRSIPFGYGLS